MWLGVAWRGDAGAEQLCGGRPGGGLQDGGASCSARSALSAVPLFPSRPTLLDELGQPSYTAVLPSVASVCIQSSSNSEGVNGLTTEHWLFVKKNLLGAYNSVWIFNRISTAEAVMNVSGTTDVTQSFQFCANQ